MRKTFHHPITEKKIMDPELGALQVECRDTSASTIGIILFFAVASLFFYYCSFVLTIVSDQTKFLIAGLLCTIAACYLFYSFKVHGVYFYEYGFQYRRKKYFYDSVEYIYIRREYFKKGHIVGRVIWDVKLKDVKKPMMLDSRDFPSLMNVMDEVCRQTSLKKEREENELF